MRVVLVSMLAVALVGGASAGKPRGYPSVAKRNLHGRIAYSTPAGDIWVMNANGTCRHRVTRSGSGQDFDPSWAPDGSRLVFRTTRGHYLPDRYGNGLEGLFVVNVDGTGEHEVQPPTGGMAARWSPRGDEIAFSGLRPGRRYDTLFLMNPDGSGVHDLGTAYGSEGAVWSPDASASPTARTTATATGRSGRCDPMGAGSVSSRTLGSFGRRAQAATTSGHGRPTGRASRTAPASSAAERSG
jgi:hypothetical protein